MISGRVHHSLRLPQGQELIGVRQVYPPIPSIEPLHFDEYRVATGPS